MGMKIQKSVPIMWVLNFFKVEFFFEISLLKTMNSHPRLMELMDVSS